MKKTLFILFLIFSLASNAQQDPLYSQYQFNQLMINPAYAGMYGRFSASGISRFQWAGIEGAPITNTLSAHTGLKNETIGIGGILLNDRFGVSNNYEIQFIGSYFIKYQQAKLGMGIQGGYTQFGYSFSDVNFDYLDDPEIVYNHSNVHKPNFGVGFMYMSEDLFLGFSIPRILNATVSDGMINSERYKRHYYFSAGFVKEINRMPYKVMGLVRSMNGETISTDISGSIQLDDIVWTGMTIRDLRHFGLFAILDLSETLRVGYSFELPSNALVYGQYGTHEISLQFDVRPTRKNIFRYKYF